MELWFKNNITEKVYPEFQSLNTVIQTKAGPSAEKVLFLHLELKTNNAWFQSWLVRSQNANRRGISMETYKEISLSPERYFPTSSDYFLP